MRYILSQISLATLAFASLFISIATEAQTSTNTLAAPAKASTTKQKTVSERWSFQCEAEHCFISQVLVARNKELAGVVGAVNVAISAENQPILTLRLSPYAKQKVGLGIKIDENKPVRVSIQHCDTKICETNIVIDDTMMKELNSGKHFMVAFMNTNEQQTTLPFSLEGFSKAYEELLATSD